MNQEQFEAILPLKVECIVREMMHQEKQSLYNALFDLYSSQLYKLLEKEETKMWYYSPMMLVEILKNEKETGKLKLPE
ncbi:MAG: hypothetical protein LBQ31_01465 [Bacteroidales bacterium]|jgi:hypothetical protein|nr:hypothetical protein [Bacteroidales bacterium]